ncbi:hypothetical protein [Aliarcobacter cryaerophilus]|uniref:Uncharacterized protein n=2 Tax=unclassified Arcobacter TaxID=2593671 RepID=A0AA96CPL4_9BACT|nr:hypothetical protein RJG52_10605 [Arcobacter sp. AZ-2023]WPD08831.1 hypothetical protein QUR77_06300 [Arcobacter sp. DSM 115954]WNL13661.1 hypothetical protein RJG51_06340 [Arcobacter sp. AZ-2023]WNL18331.1 hypothetical protein RJG53_06930 [Arcobacter sp. AZ-2023]WNL20466.1 hypothetical protein RJG56_06780 [Arcobacter sp. AZ-2023]
MNAIEQQYFEAWERLKAGKPKFVDKNMPINELNTVALEAGKKRGSLRTSNFPDLCKKIQEFEIKENPLQKCIREKNVLKEIINEKDKLWKDSLGRELMLKKRLIELEMEITSLKKKYPGIVFNLDNLF